MTFEEFAASRLPGHVLADTGHTGHIIAVALLVLAGIVIGASLVVRPPRTVPAAVWRLIIGLTLMFLLGPQVRFGYFIYPLGLVGWLALTGASRGPRRGPRAADGSSTAAPAAGPAGPAARPAARSRR